MKRSADGTRKGGSRSKGGSVHLQPVLSGAATAGSLELQDGTVLQGTSFGAHRAMAGEVVFNTGMVGYPEALTDPSYAGQILVLTYPMVGNYGVPGDERDSLGLPLHFESERIQVVGLIVAEYSPCYSHWNAKRSLGEWLAEHGVPALSGVDTRALTQRLREGGAVLGRISLPGATAPFEDPNARNLVAEVSCREVRYYGPTDGVCILAFDCGMKYNIIRQFVHGHGVRLAVVPFDYPLESNPAGVLYEGIFLSNGPGDPSMCTATVASLRWAIEHRDPVPVFGICLGNQLMAIACGGRTFKMRYGNRGMNQPCVDLRTARCYITPQNHGYAVNHASLPPDWKPLFVNANDHSNEGLIHNNKPFFSVQFHPEAQGGPTDTAFLFESFLEMVAGTPPPRALLDPALYDTRVIRRVLLVGSGGLSIGQAGEFDYSGAQAVKALKEEGIEVVLVNPNVATVQTSRHLGRASPDKVYFLPIRAAVLEDLIARERPDGIIVSMGGQTALNVGIELHEAKVFEKYNCRVLGTPIETIVATEDRQLFSHKLAEIGESLALSYCACSVPEALKAAAKIGYPVLVRATFALGGLGSGFADDAAQLRLQCEKAFAVSAQILIDQDLRGWKEIEYEVVRDSRGNCITVCNMENFDPLGVHTGDSIVVAPSQTLSNSEYFKLRSTSIKVIQSLGIVGECNIQFALDPESERYCIIEVNARLSRSSALASKATGYPLAYVAAKLSLGKDLVSIRNSITKTTTACFEPALDYCVVKMPRWDLAKFNKVSTRLGSSMTSVGEVMAIGRNFEEAIQKAVRMVTGGRLDGLDGHSNGIITRTAVAEGDPTGEDLDTLLRIPTDKRLYAVQTAFEMGYTVDQVHHLSRIDKWFLSKLLNIATLKAEAKKFSLEDLGVEALRTMKVRGFSDRQIARYTGCTEMVVRRRREQLLVTPVCKQIDTLAAEFPAQTNYCYMTYAGSTHDMVTSDREELVGGVMVLGCGAYSIGSSVEFDWCAVSAARQLRAMGERVVVVNYNPETVSTDYDESDKLYFEEISLERTLDIYELEHSRGVIVSVGGQIPNNLATPLHQQGVCILGTPAESIDAAEDRHQFSTLLDTIQVDQPEWSELRSYDEALSGDATLVLPAQRLYVQTVRAVKHAASLIAKALRISGPFNIQFLAKDNMVKVIECNLRASRTFPFVSKTLDVNFISLATKVMMGFPCKAYNISLLDYDYVAVKAPMFSFTRLRGADPTLGVEMASTGEVACFGRDVQEAYLQALLAANFKLPVVGNGKLILVSIAEEKLRMEFLESAATLTRLGFKLAGTPGTAEFYQQHGLEVLALSKPAPLDSETGPVDATSVSMYLKQSKVDLVINIPEGSSRKDEITAGYLMRRLAVDFGTSLLTNVKCAILFVEALSRNKTLPCLSADEFLHSGGAGRAQADNGC